MGFSKMAKGGASARSQPTPEWVRGRGAAGIISFTPDGEWILLVSGDPKAGMGDLTSSPWTLPKGGANREDGSMWQNAAREWREETNLREEDLVRTNSPVQLWRLRRGPVHLITCLYTGPVASQPWPIDDGARRTKLVRPDVAWAARSLVPCSSVRTSAG